MMALNLTTAEGIMRKLLFVACVSLLFTGCFEPPKPVKKKRKKAVLGEVYELRTWRNRNGKTMTGYLKHISNDGTKIQIKDKSGKIRTFKVDVFCKEDRFYLGECYTDFTSYAWDSAEYRTAIHRVMGTGATYDPSSKGYDKPKPKKITVKELNKRIAEADKVLEKTKDKVADACKELKACMRKCGGKNKVARLRKAKKGGTEEVDEAEKKLKELQTSFNKKIKFLRFPKPQDAKVKSSRYDFYRDWAKKYQTRIENFRKKMKRYHKLECELKLSYM
jgi:hypothetical protein